jgi:hypothetical protein
MNRTFKEITTLGRDSRLRRRIGFGAFVLGILLSYAAAWTSSPDVSVVFQRSAPWLAVAGALILLASVMPLVQLRRRCRRAYGANPNPVVTHAQAVRWSSFAFIASAIAAVSMINSLDVRTSLGEVHPVVESACVGLGIFCGVALLGGSLLWAVVATATFGVSIATSMPWLGYLSILAVPAAWRFGCGTCGDWVGRRLMRSDYLGSSTSTRTVTEYEDCPIRVDIPVREKHGSFTTYGTRQVGGSVRIPRGRVETTTHHHYELTYRCRACGRMSTVFT